MLTLEAPQFQIRGLTIFRDYTDPTQFYFLPSDRARVTDRGRGLEFVVYTENIEEEPNFDLSVDRAGGFLTLEVELGPDEAELEQVRSALESAAGVGGVRLAQVPFTNGSVTLYILSQTGGGGTTPRGFEVSVAGSTKPSLFGRQTAVFSARLGGKAANVLYETLRRSADPQAVVTYDLEFLGLRPAYMLEVKVKFREAFEYLRHRIGLNLLIAAADLDILTQELSNTGTIEVREIDYAGRGAAAVPLDGGVMKLVRDLVSPTLFTTVPIPTPEYRALPDSATRALETPGGTRPLLSMGNGTGEAARKAITVGTDLKLTHTPVGGEIAAGAAVPVSVKVEPGTGVTVGQVKVCYRVKGGPTQYQEVVLQADAAAAPGTPAVSPAAGPAGAPAGGPSGAPAAGPSGAPAAGPSGAPAAGPSGAPAAGPSGGPAAGPSGAPAAGPSGGPAAGPAGGPSGGPAGGPAAGPAGGPAAAPAGTPAAAGAPAEGGPTYSGRIPGQGNGVTIEYFVKATGRKAGAEVTQTLPADQPETKPLSYTVGAAQRSGVSLQVPQTDGPLVGYSLRAISVTQLVERTFTFNRTEAVTQHYHPSGALSRDAVGPEFDPAQQVTRVALGEGPFRILVIRALAGFDFQRAHILAATVHVEYGTTPAGGPLRALDIRLTKDRPAGQVQFFADEAGTQAFSYHVEFVYDPDKVIGAAGQAIRSRTFTGVTGRAITVELDQHSPLIPVEVVAGQLRFSEGTIRQVQVRVAPVATAEGRTIVLSGGQDRDLVYVLPANPASRVYYMRQEFFFRDTSTVVERANMTDTQVVVNEPAGKVFKMVPQWSDPWGLVQEILLDAAYTHHDGEREQATLHLRPDGPKSEFSVLLRPDDPLEWDAVPRFVMKSGDPVVGASQHFRIAEPLVGLSQTGFRVAQVELLEDVSIFGANGLLGIKVSVGEDVGNPALPAASLLLRGSRATGALVVPGVRTGQPVSVAVELLRQGRPPERRTAALSAAETTLYVTL
jgi:hypothetical protein